MKCPNCESTQHELLHRSQMVQLLETRLALANQLTSATAYVAAMEERPSEVMRRELEATRAALTRSEGLNVELKALVKKLCHEVVAHVARETRHQILRQPAIDALWGGENVLEEATL